jgi:hypothetical protein
MRGGGERERERERERDGREEAERAFTDGRVGDPVFGTVQDEVPFAVLARTCD